MFSAGTYVWADTELAQEVDLGALRDRAPDGKGTNYLIVGSDSRAGLSERARKELRTGSAEGRRTDSMILLHTGANGTTMVSLPRDSWVTVPAYVRPETGRGYDAEPDKLNAAFSLGGPDLLVRAVESNTGLHVDHYAEIGFAGFVSVVDAVVDKDTGLRDLMTLFRAMRGVTAGGGRQLNVPVSDPALATSKGSAVKWDERRARTLFTELRDDRPVTLPREG
ncbi:LCP family protein [Streptomyces sp. FR-108]|uniref:LCP family protein n=1 Tax=Streptomyces sp. FR-108 TaxID=3416665 RepID=UPI003CF05AA9